MLYNDVTLETWIYIRSLRRQHVSPIWFGLLDENNQARFMYGLFLVRRVSSTGVETADIEIGHTDAAKGSYYGGRYNYSWPQSGSPRNLTQIFSVGLAMTKWYHLAAVRNAQNYSWTLYVNG